MISEHCWFDVEFVGELDVGRLKAGRVRSKLPHAGSRSIETEIFLGFKVQQHGFTIQVPYQDVLRNHDAI